MILGYYGDDRLYVPLERLDLIQKYSSGENAHPPLDKLGGTTWVKTKARIKKSMRDMAEELLKLYAERRILAGYAFSPHGHWHSEFEEAFEYTETTDQLTAIEEVNRDMESEASMDRLLCGDVGFGKTEVAMRAAFKAAFDGKQVAVLAPTTVLVYQHYIRFKQRFTAFPMNIEMLSRFRSPKEQADIVAQTASGKEMRNPTTTAITVSSTCSRKRLQTSLRWPTIHCQPETPTVPRELAAIITRRSLSRCARA